MRIEIRAKFSEQPRRENLVVFAGIDELAQSLRNPAQFIDGDPVVEELSDDLVPSGATQLRDAGLVER